ncbi:hypothetical protein ACJIZ3_008598 [Penstemon smallii]|uniref:Transmembrane protein n=1 Tax=Penstemon smallii TaxID=265156 RepID=A0ABD3TAM8_9LAMI
MRKDMSPGLKILWIWTFGTAAVMVTNVVRTRMKDMEQIVNAQDQTPNVAEDNNNSSNSTELKCHLFDKMPSRHSVLLCFDDLLNSILNEMFVFHFSISMTLCYLLYL